MSEKLAFFVDMSLCMGCKACMIACKDKHNLPAGVHWRKVIEASGGQWTPLPDGSWQQNVFAYYLSISCNHCENPACVAACPARALAVGPRRALLEKYGPANIAPLPDPALTTPGLALAAHRLARPSGAQDVIFANKEEA